MRRSDFVRVAAAGMAAVTLPARGARASTAETIETLDYTLTAAPLRFRPVAGIEAKSLAYNGA